MTIHEAIAQLRSLIESSRSFRSADGDIWERDIEALTMAITALARAEWISVKDRLPMPFESVLAFVPSEAPLPTVHESYVADHDKWVCILMGEFYGTDEVTHWMPLPEPPEVSEDE